MVFVGWDSGFGFCGGVADSGILACGVCFGWG